MTNQSILRAGKPLTALKAQESPARNMRAMTLLSAQKPAVDGLPQPTGPVWADAPHEFSTCPYSEPFASL